MNLHGSRTLEQWAFHVGSVFDTSEGVLKVTSPSQGDSVEVINQYYTNNFVASVGLTHFLQAGLNLPTVYFEDGTHFETGEEFSTGSLADIGLELKLSVLKDSRIRPGIAVVSVTTFPSGSTEKFTGSSNVTEEVKLAIDKKIGPVYLNLNGGYRFLERKQVLDFDIDDMATYGAGFAWTLPFGTGALDLIAEADGAVVVRNPQENSSPLEWLVGIRQRIFEGLYAELAGGSGVGEGVGGGDFRIVTSLHFRTRPPSKEPEGERKEPEEGQEEKPSPFWE